MVCLYLSAHLNNCSDQVDMTQVQQIYARLFTHIDVVTASQAGLGRRRILLHARWQTTTCPPHAACVAVHLDPASSSPYCVGHGLATFCPYHSYLPRYKALADYPSSRRSPTLRSHRGYIGLQVCQQRGRQVRLSMRHVQRDISSSDIRHSMDADPHQWHQQNEYGNGKTTGRVRPKYNTTPMH